MKHGNWRGRQGSSGGQAATRTRLAPIALARVPAGAALALVVIGAGFAAGCSSPEDIADKAQIAPAAATSASDAAPAAVAFTDNAGKDEAAREFSYNWPAEVSAIPALAARLAAERDTLLAEQTGEWEAAMREFAGEDCAACTSRAFEKSWEVVANLPRFLSLSASFYEYSGGAHGNTAHDALVWDRERQAGFSPTTMFTSTAALQQALGAPWCKTLKAERQKRMGPDYTEDGFFPCPPIADLTVLVGSSDKTHFNRIGLLAAPYVAGSYAEGTYEVTLPVTARVLAAVKPEYKPAFAPAK